MDNRFTDFKWIRNFPKKYSLFRRILYNFVYFLFSLKLIKKVAFVPADRLLHVRKIIRKGDILLLGNLTTIYPIFFGEVLTHSAIYIGHGKVIHSVLKGVSKIQLRKLVPKYDTLVILRLPKKINQRRKIIKSVKSYLNKRIGLPYNFDFRKDDSSYYCTQLVIDALNKSGYKPNLDSFERENKKNNRLRHLIYGKVPAIHPSDLTKGDLDLIYMSDNLYLTEKKEIKLKDK